MDELQSELKNIIFLAISITRTEMELSSKVSHCMRNRIFFPQWSDTLTCFLKKIDQQHQQMIQSFANYAMKLNSQKSFDEV